MALIIDEMSKKRTALYRDMDQSPTTNISQPTELGEVLKDLNDDTLDPVTHMSGIDMRSRLHPIEISGILAVDSLVMFRLLPVSCTSFTRQKKRLSVSEYGKGRDDYKDVVGGKRDSDAKGMTSFSDRIAGIFGGGKPKDG